MIGRRPGVWAFVAFALGALVATRLDTVDPWPFTLAGGALALAAIALRGRTGAVLLALALAAGACGYTLTRWHATPSDALERLVADGGVVTVEGVVLETPRLADTQRGRMATHAHFNPRYAAAPMRIDTMVERDGSTRDASSVARLRVQGDAAWPAAAGDRVRATGVFRAVRGPLNPGEIDWRPLARERGHAGTLVLTSPDLLAPVATAGWWERAKAERLRTIARLRDRAMHAIHVDDPQADALLEALLLGQRSASFDELAEPYQRLGIAHVLAISGLHLGVLAGLVVLVVRLVGDRPRVETLVLFGALALILALVPVRAPIVRAALLVAGWRLADVFGRRYDSINTLAFIGVALLLWRPSELLNPGFQLSFGVVAALIGLTPMISRRWLGERHDPDKRSAARHASEAGAITGIACLNAWLISSPLVAWRFGIVSPLGVLASIAIIPFVTLLLGVGYAVILAGLVSEDAAAAMRMPLVWLAEGMSAFVFWMDRLPGSSMLAPDPGLAWAVAMTAVAWWWLACGARPRWAFGLALVALIAWSAWAFMPRRLPEGVALRMDTLAVGDGACHLVRSGREAMLFDCGSQWFGVGQRLIPDAVRTLDAPRISTVVISHDDVDHYAGLLDAAEPMGVRRVLISGPFERAAGDPKSAAAALLGGLRARGITIEVVGLGDAFTLGDARVEVLHPPRDFIPERALDNDASLVLLLTVDTEAGPRRVMLCGDIEAGAMESILARRPGLRVDAMEAPHHGSARPFAYAFVERIDPLIVVQSTGPSRIDDERWDAVRRDRTWWTTAKDGAAATVVGVDGAVRVGAARE